MKLSDRIAAKQAADTRNSIEVKRWGETLYFRKLTPRDVDNLTRAFPTFFENPTLAAIVDLIVKRAENEAGEKLFSLEDKPLLMSEPVEIINEIGAVIMPKTQSPAEIEGN